MEDWDGEKRGAVAAALGPKSQIPLHIQQAQRHSLVLKIHATKDSLKRQRRQVSDLNGNLKKAKHALAKAEKGRARVQPLVASLALAARAAERIRAPPLW